MNRFGRIDLFINNAGIGIDEKIINNDLENDLKISQDAMDLIINVNLVAVMRLT